MYRKYIKRLLDIICALLALICFGWLYIIVAVLVRIKLGSPVLFSQERPGKNEKIFKVHKFRTMSDAKDANGKLLHDSQRLGKFGAILRKCSLDELPCVFNILSGDMSIVGPRPLSPVYLPYYNEEEKKRHTVRPGLTGLAQVNGRNAIPWERRFAYDLEYIESITFINDVKIIFKTVLVALKQEDIEQGESRPVSFHVLRAKEWEEKSFKKN